jgi:hypothetical protein
MAKQNSTKRINLLVSNEGENRFNGVIVQVNGVIRIRRQTPKRRRN